VLEKLGVVITTHEVPRKLTKHGESSQVFGVAYPSDERIPRPPSKNLQESLFYGSLEGMAIGVWNNDNLMQTTGQTTFVCCGVFLERERL
jgi:hypothetical protein